MSKTIETKKDGKESERFVDLARKLVAVPKAEIDRSIAKEREAKDKNKKRKA
jgi:hypothetical protein